MILLCRGDSSGKKSDALILFADPVSTYRVTTPHTLFMEIAATSWALTDLLLLAVVSILPIDRCINCSRLELICYVLSCSTIYIYQPDESLQIRRSSARWMPSWRRFCSPCSWHASRSLQTVRMQTRTLIIYPQSFWLHLIIARKETVSVGAGECSDEERQAAGGHRWQPNGGSSTANVVATKCARTKCESTTCYCCETLPTRPCFLDQSACLRLCTGRRNERIVKQVPQVWE